MFHRLILQAIEDKEDKEEELEEWQVSMRAGPETVIEEERTVELCEIVSVKFSEQGRKYDYLCKKGFFKTGDTGVAPPSWYRNESAIVSIVEVKPLSERRSDIQYKWLERKPDRTELIDLERDR